MDPAARHQRTEVLRLLALWTFTLALALLVATAASLYDRDEPRFAKAALEMAASGDWLVPTFRGELRPDKPVLGYWAMAAGMWLCGPVAAGARLPAALALATSVVLLQRIGARLLGRQAGWTAALCLALAPLPLAEGSLATVDSLLLLWTMLAVWTGMRMVFEGSNALRTALFGVWLGLALLTKGPVGLAVPLLAFSAAAWMARDGATGARWKPALAGALLGTLIFLAWAIPADAATGGEYARRGLGTHVAQRMAAPMEGHGGNWFLSLPYYLPVVVLGLHPWSVFLPAAWRRARDAQPRTRTVLAAWTLPVLALMTLVATKLPHYALPAWPGLCLAVAATLHGPAPAARPRGAWRAELLLALGSTLLAGGALALPLALRSPHLWPGATGFALLQLAMVVAAWRPLREGRPLDAFGRLCAGATAVWLWTALVLLPSLERENVQPQLAALLRRCDAGAPLATYKCREPSLDFALHERVVRDLESDEAVLRWLREVEGGVLALPAADAERLGLDGGAAGPLLLLGEVEGLNLAKGRRTRLQAWSR